MPFMLSADNIRAAAHFDDGGKRWDTVKNSKAANFTFLHSLLIMVNKCLEFQTLKAGLSEEKLSLMPCLRTLSNVLF